MQVYCLFLFCYFLILEACHKSNSNSFDTFALLSFRAFSSNEKLNLLFYVPIRFNDMEGVGTIRHDTRLGKRKE